MKLITKKECPQTGLYIKYEVHLQIVINTSKAFDELAGALSKVGVSVQELNKRLSQIEKEDT